MDRSVGESSNSLGEIITSKLLLLVVCSILWQLAVFKGDSVYYQELLLICRNISQSRSAVVEIALCHFSFAGGVLFSLSDICSLTF